MSRPATHFTALPRNTPPYYTVHRPTTQYTALLHGTPPYHTMSRPATHFTALPRNTPPYHTLHRPTTQYTALLHITPPYYTGHRPTTQYRFEKNTFGVVTQVIITIDWTMIACGTIILSYYCTVQSYVLSYCRNVVLS